MKQLLQAVVGAVGDDFGYPASLNRVLDEYPDLLARFDEPGESIKATSLIEWNYWGRPNPLRWPCRRPGELQGWYYASGRYQSFRVVRGELASFGTHEVVEGWTCDIGDVDGLYCSKSDLGAFGSLDGFAEGACRGLIEPIDDEKLRENLAWGEIRILNREQTSDHFVRYRWDGRLFLANSGGSHHFAAARYLAGRLGRLVPLRGKLQTYGLDDDAVLSLLGDFDVFLISDAPEPLNSFHDAMRRFRATYLWCDLPARCDLGARAVFLPKSEARSAKVAGVFRERGGFDLGWHLRGLVARQQSHAF